MSPSLHHRDLLGAPRSGVPLVEAPSTLLVPGAKQGFRLGAHQGTPYVNFVEESDTNDEVRAQQAVYDTENNRYETLWAEDKAHVLKFIDAFVAGRVQNKERLLRETILGLGLSESSRVVEVGCNDGRYVDAICALTGSAGIGIDLSERAIRRAIETKPASVAVDFHVGLADALPLKSNSVDCVFSIDVYEHLGHDGVARALEEAARVLRPGGVVVAYVVSRKDDYTLHATQRQVSNGRVGVDDGEGHRYENFLLPDEFRAMAASAGLKTRQVSAHHGFWTLYAEEVFGYRLPTRLVSWLGVLDSPLTRKEYGNGFLAIAEKGQ